MQKARITIKNSVVIVCDKKEELLEKAVKNFEIADKTPTDCFDFIRKLKALLK